MKRWIAGHIVIVVLIALTSPGGALAQSEFGELKVERVTQERRWVDVVVTYHNTTEKTFASVEIQCVARSSSDQLLGEETWFHGEADRRPRFRPDSKSIVTVQIDIRAPTPRAASASCVVTHGREASG